MAVSLENFVQQLEDSGILAGDTLKDYIPPKACPKDATDLARELVRQKKLTKFQAEEVSKGKGKSLVLGNYLLMEKIGAGGMGQVFKARHRRMDRFVAVKLLPTAMTKDKAAIARFEREVKAAAKLRHPNIVAADDADCANGVHFLVMEMVEGQDLSALVKKNGPFSIEKAVDYVLQAAKGLEFAHKKGVVHRDIKPANLLLDNEGVVKILDMGLARLNGDDDGSPQADLTNTGTIMGTVDYMAPEQALDTKTADARADIYALGCSLYYLLTGKSTYDGDTLMKRLLAHREQPIPSLRAARPEVSDPLVAVFQKMVAKKIEDRYQTMAEVITELERCTAGPTTSVTIQQPATTTLDDVTFDFLKKPLEEPTILAKPPKKSATGKSGNGKNRLVLIGAAFVGIAILAGIIVSLRTKDGTLVVEIDQPDANVQVLDAEGEVEISQKGGKGLVSISVDPGKHRLKIDKDGFTVFGQDFEMKSGGKTPIKAKLVPLDEKPAMVGTKPVPVVPIKPPAVAGEKKPLAFEMPGFDQWVKEVAALPAEQQVEAVSKKLMELNPGFDGKVFDWDGTNPPSIENGVVTQFRFSTVHVTDISPVRALANLRSLHCIGQTQDGAVGKLVDLTPLNVMQLEYLDLLSNPAITDLSPLQGMKLTQLNCNNTKVADLSPLKGMLLTNLGLAGTPVSDLSPLKGMPLLGLNLQNCGEVSDLSPLAGMKLVTLRCVSTKVADLSPLKGMPLTELQIYATQVTDHTVLRDMPLKALQLSFKAERDTDLLRSIKTLENINGKPTAEFWKDVEAQQAAFEQWTKDVAAMPAEQQVEAVSKKLVELNSSFDGKVTPEIHGGIVWSVNLLTDNVTDISPLRALVGLKRLGCSGSIKSKGKLADLSPLKGMPLTELDFHNTQVSDLTPLKGMKLTGLICQQTQVSDLSPLSGMELLSLNCESTSVVDLSPFRDIQVTGLSLSHTHVSDLSPLKDLKLTSLIVDFTEVSDLSPLKGMPLTYLSFYTTSVSDLSPLVSMPIEHLNANATFVTDLSPLKGMPLKILIIGTYQGTHITDLSPLKDLPLQQLWLDFKPHRDTALLRSIKTLETINNKPATEFYETVESYQAAAKKPLAYLTPAFDQWVKQTAALPAEEQVKAVSTKLVELNPRFDGKLTPMIEKGVVVMLDFLPNNVMDISPVRAFKGLKGLQCTPGVGGIEGGLGDLSPLTGMPLTMLNINYAHVSDLSPLKGMKLDSLNCISGNITDLTPLEGMPLTTLNIDGNPVSDLSLLKGMPLMGATFHFTLVTDLFPLQGMPLRTLNCSKTKVTDMSLLKDMPLKNLWLDFKPERDTELLRSIKTLESINEKPAAEFWKEVEEQQKGKKRGFQMPGFDQWVKDVQAMPAEQQVEAVSKKLVELNPGFDGKMFGANDEDTPSIHEGIVWNVRLLTDDVTDLSPVRALAGLSHLICMGRDLLGQGKLVDLTPLKDMKLTSLGVSSNQLSDLSPLKGLPLTSLNIQATQVADLSPLQRMPLTALFCSFAKIADLSPLQGMPLTHLQIEGTQVADLSPLKGMPLKSLHIDSTQVSDLSPLKDLPLTTLKCPFTQVSDLSPLQGMKLTDLWCQGTLVADLSPLKDLPLQQLWLDFTPNRDTALLRSIKTLETINEKPAAEFCEKVDAYNAEAKRPLAFEAPGFDQWVKETSALPAEQQVAAVSKKLVELNPGFDGKATGGAGTDKPVIENGVVKSFVFLADNVTDVSPLRALEGLSGLGIHGSTGSKGQLLNLSPLRGLPLTHLDIYSTKVSDLSPLRGMKLTYLHCNGTFVSDLSPLKGMKLEGLDCGGTRVHDISPLNGMPLTDLRLNATLVSELSPLQGMKLTFLWLGYHVTDLSPLKGMPLNALIYFHPERHTELLRSIKTLETINNKPAAEFWKEVEEKK